MKLNRALGSIRAAYPINAEKPVEAKHICIVAPSKRFPNNEFLLGATNIDALNDQKDNNGGRLSYRAAYLTKEA